MLSKSLIQFSVDGWSCVPSLLFTWAQTTVAPDLIDRVPDELWTEVRDIVLETGIKTIPMEKKCKKAKWLSDEALQIAEKRREAKGKGEKERYIHLNVEFQRIARRDKKAFLSDRCKEIEENNGMGKTRDLFKKIEDTKAGSRFV